MKEHVIAPGSLRHPCRKVQNDPSKQNVELSRSERLDGCRRILMVGRGGRTPEGGAGREKTERGLEAPFLPSHHWPSLTFSLPSVIKQDPGTQGPLILHAKEKYPPPSR